MTRRLRLSLPLALATLALAMGRWCRAVRARVPAAVSAWLQLVFATPVVLWAARRSSRAAGRRSGTAARTCSR
jgi:Cu+-exporting ATPase